MADELDAPPVGLPEELLEGRSRHLEGNFYTVASVVRLHQRHEPGRAELPGLDE